MLLKQSMKKKKCFAKNDKNILQQIIYILQEFFFYYQVLVKVLGQDIFFYLLNVLVLKSIFTPPPFLYQLTLIRNM